MSISVQYQGTHCSVAVLGPLLSATDRAELLALLKSPAASSTPPKTAEQTGCEVVFYDAKGVPPEVVEALAERSRDGPRLKIVAYQALLRSSLARLGLPVRLVSPPALERQLRWPAPLKVLAMGGSAQSLDKVLRVIESMSPSSLVIFVVQHVREDYPNLLDQLLKMRTDYRVEMPQHLVPVRAGTVYVAPSGYHMKVAHGLVYLTRDLKVQFSRPSIDVLYESLAAEYGAGVLAIVFCGYGRDGVQGCAALRDAGSVVIAEDGDECAPARAMPDAVRDTQQCDFVLKVSGIVNVLATAALENADPGSRLVGPALDGFLDAVRDQYGQDFRQYQRDSLERRIAQVMRQSALSCFAQFQCWVLSDAAVFERFCSELPVGVTSFFRHPQQFSAMREQVVQYLNSFPVVKLWCAGCSTGEEAYSVSILLEEAGLHARSHLFATDINPDQLEQAKSALFPLNALDTARQNYQSGGGVHQFDDYLVRSEHFIRMADRLRDRILFYRHSLTGDGIFNEFQLIICRNVMIYFNVDLQRHVLQRFARSLHRDGFLVLGPKDGTNLLVQEMGFVLLSKGSFVYRLKSA